MNKTWVVIVAKPDFKFSVPYLFDANEYTLPEIVSYVEEVHFNKNVNWNYDPELFCLYAETREKGVAIYNERQAEYM